MNVCSVLTVASFLMLSVAWPLLRPTVRLSVIVNFDPGSWMLTVPCESVLWLIIAYFELTVAPFFMLSVPCPD